MKHQEIPFNNLNGQYEMQNFIFTNQIQFFHQVQITLRTTPFFIIFQGILDDDIWHSNYK